MKRFLSGYLNGKFGEMSYQLWRYDGGSEKVTFLDGTRETIFPPTCGWENTMYSIKKQSGYTDLYFYYPEKHSLLLRIFRTIEAVDNAWMEQLFFSMYPFVLEEKLEAKHREQEVLLESMHSVTSTLDLNDVLKAIIKHALRVIPQADAGFLMLYEPKQQRLIPKAPVGFNDTIYQFKTKVGESITGKVFEDGKGRIFNSYQEISDAMHANNILPENFSNIHNASDNVEVAICVPVSISDKQIGVMIIHQRKRKKALDQSDISLLEGFATQAAIALENAWYHTETRERLQQIASLSGQLQEKNEQLQKRQDVHDTLTMLSLENKGINRLVDGVRNMMGRDILFFNGLENAYYSPEQAIGEVFSVFEINTLFSGRRRDFSVSLIMEEKKNFYFYPLYNGTVFLGCLVIPMGKTISEFDRIILEQGSTVLALEMVNRQTATKIYHHRVYEQFRELLTCDNRNELLKRGKEMNLDTAACWVVVVLEIPKSNVDLHYLDIKVHQLADRIRREWNAREKLIYGFDHKITLLLPLSDDKEVDEIKERLHNIRMDEENRDGAVFRGALSSVYSGLEHISKCYETADKTISYLASKNSLGVIRFEDIGLNRLFLNQPTEDIEAFINENLTPLIDENDRYTELKKTLFTYMDANRSSGKTAKQLHIHINTFYQRIRKIEELLGVDLNDNEDILKIQLACHLQNSRMAIEENMVWTMAQT